MEKNEELSNWGRNWAYSRGEEKEKTINVCKIEPLMNVNMIKLFVLQVTDFQ